MSTITQGVDHIGLTVTDLDAAAAFFQDALGFELLGGRPSYPALFVSDGTVMVTLWAVKEPEAEVAFNRFRNVGLHHLALRVATLPELNDLHERLAQRADVEIEFAPEPLGAGPATHMMCAGPSGIRIEFITRSAE